MAGNSAAIWPAVRLSWSRRISRIARRVGSASAENVSLRPDTAQQGFQLHHAPAVLEPPVILGTPRTEPVEAVVQELDERAAQRRREPERDQRGRGPAAHSWLVAHQRVTGPEPQPHGLEGLELLPDPVGRGADPDAAPDDERPWL